MRRIPDFLDSPYVKWDILEQGAWLSDMVAACGEHLRHVPPPSRCSNSFLCWLRCVEDDVGPPLGGRRRYPETAVPKTWYSKPIPRTCSLWTKAIVSLPP